LASGRHRFRIPRAAELTPGRRYNRFRTGQGIRETRGNIIFSDLVIIPISAINQSANSCRAVFPKVSMGI